MTTIPAPVSRRAVTAGLAWSAPAVALASAAPAFAASHCDLSSLPGGTVAGTIGLYAFRLNNIQYIGSDGALGTVSWWTEVYKTSEDPATQSAIRALGCDPAQVQYVDNSTTPFSYTVDVVRNAGSTSRFRTMALNNADAQFNRLIDPNGAGGSAASGPTYDVGETVYRWQTQFPSYAFVYNLNAQHRSYTTISAGDGGISGGRITDQLRLNGTIVTFENQGDKVF